MVDEQKYDGLLVPTERYLESGIHIGTKIKTGDTKDFIFKKRRDRIYIIDLKKIDDGIRNALEVLKKYDVKDILIVATRMYAINASRKLKQMLDIETVEKRFVPGTFTNKESKHFKEPEIVLVCDPRNEKEAIREANMMNIPVIGLVDTDNTTRGLDVVIPMNNKGRKSLALFFWILARELLLKEGKIKSYDEFKLPITYFERLEIE